MRRWAAAVLLGSWPVIGTVAAQDLTRAVDAAEALGARTGIAVCDSDGRVLFRHRATDLFAPASNMKLLCAAAVLQGLGPDYAFTTTFAWRNGRLVIAASGDPNWIHDTEHDPARVFAAVAQALQRLGVKRLAGIDLQPGSFTGPARPATWPQDQLQAWYCAPTGPFVLEQGTFHVRIEARGGDHAAVAIAAPAVDVRLTGAIDLVARAKNATYGATDVGDAVTVRGRFPRKGSPVTIRTAVADPAAWYLAALHKALAAAGIAVGGLHEPAIDDQVVHVHRSALRPAFERMLEDSSNFDAEQCLRVLGHHTQHDGSLDGGIAALRAQVLSVAGQIPDGAVFADGSGLSKHNRVTPGLLLVAMVRADGRAAGAMLRECLPVAGRSGTLADRFIGTDLVGRVRAKTGWIRGASALSGMVERRDGSTRWFAILMNYDPKQDGLNKDLKRLQEQMVRAIDELGPSR